MATKRKKSNLKWARDAAAAITTKVSCYDIAEAFVKHSRVLRDIGNLKAIAVYSPLLFYIFFIFCFFVKKI
jgi:hypothetical protein